MEDGEVEGAGQLAAGPVERIETWAATRVLARHLAHDYLGVGEDAQHFGLQMQGMLQSLKERDVLGYVVVLVADPLGDPDLFASGILKHHTDTRWSGTAMRSAVDVGYKY